MQPSTNIDNKGVGYQAQVSQTHNPDNPVQIVTAVIPQSASESDQNAVGMMIEKNEQVGAKPEELLADSGYGSDENVVKAFEQGIELVAPATGKEKGSLGLEECEFDEYNRIIKCPLGKKPLKKTFKNGKGRAVFTSNCCRNCPKYKQCKASKQGNNYIIEYEEKSLRLRERRLHEQTDEFNEQYRPRGGIEALFGNLKQNTPLRRLGVRGKSAVFNAIYSIMAIHNIMQAAKVYVDIDKRGRKTACQVVELIISGLKASITRAWDDFLAPLTA